MLAGEGVEVKEAATTQDALALVRERKPGVILLDIVFEEEDRWGYELCVELRELAPDVPIIGLSSRSRPADRQMMQRQGAVAYLTKKELTASAPAGRDLLIRTIKQFCPAASSFWAA